jgi:N-acetyl sugar amidotransferase
MKENHLGLPNNVKFCTTCVISNQRPSSTIEFKHDVDTKKPTIGFDETGQCDACRFSTTKNVRIDWASREEDLLKLLDRFRKDDGSHDVVVPGSGGKDSAFTAHILKYKYGMNPLTVTWAPHKYTKIGWQNFENWMHIGGLDNLLFTPNGKLHRYLTQQAFLNLLHPFQPFIIGQKIIGPAMAAKFGVPLVMYGENQAEYGNDLKDNNSPLMDYKFFSTQNPNEIVLGGKQISEIISETSFIVSCVSVSTVRCGWFVLCVCWECIGRVWGSVGHGQTVEYPVRDGFPQ